VKCLKDVLQDTRILLHSTRSTAVYHRWVKYAAFGLESASRRFFAIFVVKILTNTHSTKKRRQASWDIYRKKRN